MVFDPTAAPRDHASFMRWYEAQTTWGEGHSYDDHRVCSPALQRWFLEMIETFPPMNGPIASKDYDPFVTDHCCGRDVIYSAFAWSVADTARKRMRELAIKYGLGFYDVGGDPGEILFPGEETASNQRLERP
jgi:hypothetical protein